MTQLQPEHSDSVYALYAALFASQQAVHNNDLEAAAAQLSWLLDNAEGGLFSSVDQGLVLTGQLRLGRVLLGQNELDKALDLVEGVDPGTFEAEFAELRGDIYLAQGRPQDARDAYTTAVQVSGSSSPFLQMKLDELRDGS